MSQATLAVLYPQEIPLLCQYEYPETRPGACNGFPCAAKATIFDLSEEREFCVKHFRGVSRG
jgi:hypothetical protein